MKDFPYKEGDLVTIYRDWQNELDPLGTARLVRKYAPGRTFILKEMLPEYTQLVYNYERWIVEDVSHVDIGRIVNIRFLEEVGLHTSLPQEEEDGYDFEDNKILKDTFLTVNGKEIF